MMATSRSPAKKKQKDTRAPSLPNVGWDGQAFKDWADAEKLTNASPIEHCKDMRIGIDGGDWAQSLMAVAPPEPLLNALGGVPFSLTRRVDEELQKFADAGIEPLFIFDGLPLVCRSKSSVLRESRKAESLIRAAWNTYDGGKPEPAVEAFSKIFFYRSEHIMRSLQFYLRNQGARVQMAPYSAAAQLVYMEREEYIDGIYGSPSCLLFGTDKIITGFDWNKNTFIWLAMNTCLTKLGLSRDQFTDVCLLSGCSILHILPDLDTDAATPRMDAARALLSRVGYEVSNLFPNQKDEYYDLWMKARCILKHPIIMTHDGKVEPLDWENAPGDSHYFNGQKLPEELYSYLAFGFLSPRVSDWRTRTEIIETQPLDGGDAEPYRRLVQEKLLPLRAQAVALMTPLLHRYYQKQDVTVTCWWNENSKTTLNITDAVESLKATDGWNVVSESLPAPDPHTSTPLSYAILSLADPAVAKATLTLREAGSAAYLEGIQTQRANIVWRFLEERGYVNADHTLSGWGRTLKGAFDQAHQSGLMKMGINDTEIEEAIFMTFELLRLEVLNNKAFTFVPAYSGGALRGSEADKSHTLFISRLVCVGAVHHKTLGFTGPLSRQLLAYHQMVAAVRGALRDLVEMQGCNMFLSGCANRDLTKAQYCELGATMPLAREPDLGLALLVKNHLDEQCRPAEERSYLEKWFQQVIDIPGNLSKAWGLWDAVCAGVEAADDSMIGVDMKKTFGDATEWLASKRAYTIAPADAV